VNVAFLKEEGAGLELAIGRDVPLVQCDGELIHSVVMDLLSNALYACSWKQYEVSDTPRAILRVQQSAVGGAASAVGSVPTEGHVAVAVSDNGEGTTEEVRSNMFTPFFSTKEEAGAGMAWPWLLESSAPMEAASRWNQNPDEVRHSGCFCRSAAPASRRIPRFSRRVLAVIDMIVDPNDPIQSVRELVG
jgi:hypothetical protein